MTSTEGSGATAKQGGLFEDLMEVLYSPSAVFQRTRATSPGKYLVVTAIIVAVILFGTKNLLQPWFDAQADLSLKLLAAKGKAIPDAAAASVGTQTTWAFLIGGPITMLVGPFLNALMILVGAKLMKAQLSFGQAATIATLAGVPRLFGWLSMPIQSLVLDGSTARSLSDLSIGPARFVDPAATPPAILALLGNLDLFRLWQIALIAIGVAVVAKVPKSTGAIVAIIMFGISAGLQLIPSALF